MLKAVLNMVIFYTGWLTIVASQSKGYDTISYLILPVLIVAHLLFVSKKPKVELLILPLVAVLGFMMDGLVAQLGFLKFVNPQVPAPIWLFELWILFAMTLDYAMRPILERPWLAAVLGFFAAPLTYLTGEFWQIVHYQSPKYLGMLIHGLAWALLLYFLLAIYRFISQWVEKRILGASNG